MDRDKSTGRKKATDETLRNDLFATDTSASSLRQRKTASEEQAAQGVTEGLIELRQMMQTQLQHGKDTVDLLARSSNQIQHTKTGMEEIGVSINVGQGLISKLGRRDITDKVLIFLALIFFFSVVLYVIRKRLIGWII